MSVTTCPFGACAHAEEEHSSWSNRCLAPDCPCGDSVVMDRRARDALNGEGWLMSADERERRGFSSPTDGITADVRVRVRTMDATAYPWTSYTGQALPPGEYYFCVVGERPYAVIRSDGDWWREGDLVDRSEWEQEPTLYVRDRWLPAPPKGDEP